MKAKLKAFTLIELLIVVAIIAILAAIAVPNFLEARVRSQVSRVKADQRTYATGIESYYVDWNQYPCDITAICAVGGAPLLNPCVNPISITTQGIENCLVLEAWMYGLSSPISYLAGAVVVEPFNARQGIALFEGCDVVGTGGCDDRSTRTPVYGYIALPNDDVIAFFMPLLINFIAGALPSLTVTPDLANSIIRKRWGLVSPGPDTFFSYDRCLLQTPGLGAFCLFDQVADAFIDSRGGIYDPTNGTISRGEIVRHAGGISFSR